MVDFIHIHNTDTDIDITSTTLYITCIAGCMHNFIHITRILFNFANDIAGGQYNFIHITRILFNFANDIGVLGVPNQGPK
jgi:hypothetical protein